MRWDPHVILILTIINYQLISVWSYMSVEQAFFLTSIVVTEEEMGEAIGAPLPSLVPVRQVATAVRKRRNGM